MVRKVRTYTPGRKAQYGAARWERYEKLRVAGFMKQEARELSRLTDQPEILDAMTKQRRRLLIEFSKLAIDAGITNKQARFRWPYYVKRWYNRNNLTSSQGRFAKPENGGKPDVFVWYNRTENALAKKRGWKKGEYDRRVDSGESIDDVLRDKEYKRRRRAGSPGGKGKVSAQRKRAKERAKSFKSILDMPDSPGVRKIKRFQIDKLRERVKAQPELDESLTKKAKQLGFTGNSLLKTRGH